MINKEIFLVWIKINLLNLHRFLISIFTEIQLENSRSAKFIKKFERITIMINPVTITQFFKAIYTGIFIYLLAIESIECDLLWPVSIYFGMIKTNSQKILHLH